jgi:hypothetical protein
MSNIKAPQVMTRQDTTRHSTAQHNNKLSKTHTIASTLPYPYLKAPDTHFTPYPGPKPVIPNTQEKTRQKSKKNAC